MNKDLKLALCLSGNPRCFKLAYLNIKSHILDKYDCDTFIFTFKKSKDLNYGITNSFRYPDEDSIENYLDLYKPKKHLIEDYTQEYEDYFCKLEKMYNAVHSDGRTKRYLAQLYGISKCNDLVGIRSKFYKYDYMIRIRPDVHLDHFELPKTTNLAIDHHGNGSHANAPGDIFACGRPLEMHCYSDLFFYLNAYFVNDKVSPSCEHSLEHHLKFNKVEYEITNNTDYILRPKEWNHQNPLDQSKFNYEN